MASPISLWLKRYLCMTSFTMMGMHIKLQIALKICSVNIWEQQSVTNSAACFDALYPVNDKHREEIGKSTYRSPWWYAFKAYQSDFHFAHAVAHSVNWARQRRIMFLMWNHLPFVKHRVFIDWTVQFLNSIALALSWSGIGKNNVVIKKGIYKPQHLFTAITPKDLIPAK